MYIRTKDGVYEVETPSKENDYLVEDDTYILTIKGSLVYKKNIVKQSESLEELCDEFVEEFPIYKGNELVGKDHHYWKYNKENKTFYDDFDDNILHKYFINKEFNFYGDIYMDKGLIYVAKMNEEGKLVLI